MADYQRALLLAGRGLAIEAHERQQIAEERIRSVAAWLR